MTSILKPPRLQLMLAVIAVSLLSLTAAQSEGNCTLPDSVIQTLDFSGIGAACQGEQVPCGACLCQIGRLLYAQLLSAGVDIPGDLTTGNQTAVTDFVAACRGAVGLQLLTTSGLSTDALVQLQSCPVDAISDDCFVGLANSTVAPPPSPSSPFPSPLDGNTTLPDSVPPTSPLPDTSPPTSPLPPVYPDSPNADAAMSPMTSPSPSPSPAPPSAPLAASRAFVRGVWSGASVVVVVGAWLLCG